MIDKTRYADLVAEATNAAEEIFEHYTGDITDEEAKIVKMQFIVELSRLMDERDYKGEDVE